MSEEKQEWTIGEPGYLPGNSPVGRNWIAAILDKSGSRVATAQALEKEELLKVSHLIAAAPDLLEACKEAADICAIEFPGLEENSTVKMLRAAIAKATAP
jgi:hypothetical protein